MRLAGGSSVLEGRVEVFHSGHWGTVCDDSWDNKDAAVVCRQLGHYGGQHFGGAHFGRGSGHIFLDDMNCSGTEARLVDCPRHHPWQGWHSNCNHGEDAGVRCSTSNRPPAFTTQAAQTVAQHKTAVVTLVAPDPESDPVTFAITGGADRALFALTGAQLAFLTAPDYGAPADANRDNIYEVTVEATDGREGHKDTLALKVSVVTAVAPGPARGDLRLVGGSSALEGRVELFHNGKWGTVCDDRWDNRDAAVVCRQLGYQGGQHFGGAHFGRGSGHIFLDDVNCSGTESRLIDCPLHPPWNDPFFPFGRNNCNHGEDAGVKCSTSNGPPAFTTQAAQSVVENTTAAVTLEAPDPDSDPVTFAITGGADRALFALDGAQLAFLTAPDYEAPADADGDNIYEVTVQVAEQGVVADTLALQVSVTDDNEVNDAPVFTTQAAHSVVENLSKTVTLAARDDDGDPVTFAIAGGADADDFALTGAQLALRAAPDYEAPTDANGDNIYEVTVEATDGQGGRDTLAVTMTVTNLEDERPPGSIRLVGGSSALEGRVELFHSGQWGTVCDDRWDNRDAAVVCRQLGYQGGQHFGGAHFGRGSGHIFLDDMNCSGTEARLVDCPFHNPWQTYGHTNCNHGEDAGVKCAAAEMPSGSAAVEPAVNGNTLTMTFARRLIPGPAPQGSAFSVQAAQSGGPVRAIAGTGQARIAGRTVTVRLARAVWPGDTATASYKRLQTDPRLRDFAGEEVVDFSDVPATNEIPAPAPSVLSVGIVQASAGSKTVRAEVRFSAPVKVESTVGAPTLALITDGTIRRASYESGSDTARIVFAYRMGETDGRPDAVRVAASGLKLNGGAIVAAAGGTPALLGFGSAPSVTEVVVADEADGRREAGDIVAVTLRFAEPVTVGGTPSVALSLGDVERRAAYAGGSGSETLSFGYKLVEADGEQSDVKVVKDSLSLGGGSIVSTGGGLAAALAHPGVERVQTPTPPSLSIADTQGPEGSALAFAVSLSPASAETVTVAYATADGTASGGADYTAASGTLTFAPGETAKTVEVAALADEAAESEETFTVALTNAQGATVADGEATGTVADVAPGTAPGLTAAFVGMPAEHNGKKLFSFELRFSEDFPGRLRYKLLRDEAFQVTNGRVRVAKRVAQRQNRRWTIKVRPASFEDVVITLPAATDCAAAGAVCTEAGRKLSATTTATVPGPVALSVADAKAREGVDPAVVFPVTLSRAVSHEVTVRYRTVDGTAKAGEDYAAASGRLVFAAGEIEKAVRVPVRDDAHDERRERFRLRLSNPQGARIADGVAVGTIVNNDPLQKMWLSRFGRTVAIQTIEALEGRFALASEASPRMTMTVAGQDLDLSRAGDGKALAETMTGLARAFGAPDAANDDDLFARRGFGGSGSEADASASARRLTGRELLHGSSFHFTTGAVSGPGGAMTGWGKVLSGESNGSSSGGLSFASETATGVLGMDWERDRLLVGVALSQSVETGSASFAPSGSSGGSRYDIEGSLSMVTPYMRLGSGERLSFWGAAGSGSGTMSLSQGAGWQTADIAMRLAAAGARAELLRPGGGLALALKTDAFFVRTESERVSTPGLGNLAAATGDASRVRAVLEGSRLFALAGGGALEPSLELGLRHDGGDAETGTGVEFGGGVSWTDPGSGLTLEAKARMLAAHSDRDYDEWGVSGAVRLSPGEGGRGLSFSLAPTLGAASSGSERLWGTRDARGLAPGTGSGAGAGGGFEAARGLRGELGYGVALSGNRFTGTPNLGFGLSDSTRDYRIGWRLTPAAPGGPGFEVGLDATRREAANDNGAAEHGVGFRLTARW